MKKGVSFLFKLHRITGRFIVLFFLMWFVTGLVLLYHPYPKVSDELVNEKKEELPSSLPSVQDISQLAGGEIKKLQIRQFQGQTLLSVSTKDSICLLNADTLEAVKPIDFPAIEKIARHWIDAPVLKVDTLMQRAQWVLFTKYDKELPIYRFYFDDKEKHELFLSGRTGEVLQLTDKESRFWAWIGAIPHKFYIPAIRRDVDTWQNTITCFSAIALIAALSGWILGWCLLVKRYRRKRTWQNPYKKRWHRWHFAFGMVFGLFLIGWAVSGIFAMQRVPQWMIPMEGDYSFKTSRLWGKKPLPMSAYRLDYRKLKETYPQLKEVEWTHFREIPAYRIVEGTQERYINASSSDVKMLQIPESTIIEGFRAIHGDSVAMNVCLLKEFDNYYLSRRVSLSLPVYKIEVDDANGSLYYVSPVDGYVRYLNNNKMVRKWLFNGIHYLDIDWLLAHPWLWTVCIWTLCIGCGVVCLSGTVLGGLWLLKRKRK